MDLQELYNTLTDLVDAGKTKEANTLLLEQFPKLPPQMQGEILLRMNVQAMNDEADRLEGIAKLQEDGEIIVQALDIVRNSIAK